ncbi:MAG: DDE-type integrase/transposase/recombinase [bacterium]
MKEDTEAAWEEVPESGPENFREGEEELGEEPGEKVGKDTPGPGRARATGKPTRMKLADGRPLGSTYPFELRKRLVLLHITKGIPFRQIEQDSGVGKDTVRKWAIRYRKFGEDGLKTGGAVQKGREQIPKGVKGIIADTKRSEPSWGVTKISQFLKRVLHLPGSPETVRQTLKACDMIETKPPRPAKMPTKPRFFERSTPNQLWQTDIFTFRLGGKNAYLIGFIDDYSRYIVSLGLFRSQTAEHVLETYRRAVGEYGVPCEMLTDNGRQYTAWRGNTRFEQELKKDRVKHIKSQPHHPMTLGKIERFWQNINGEFLSRTQFDSFEQAIDRVAIWVKHYNHKRPHQGIGGMCPADRFFEVRSDLRKVIERGIEDNLVELALRGKPQKPFYMVGRVDGQSVVMHASKGKLLMTVGDGENNQKSEVLCDLQQGKVTTHEDENGNEDRNEGGKDGAGSTERGTAVQVHGAGEVPGGAGPLDGAQHGVGAVQGDGHDMEHAEPLAGTGHGGDDAGPRAEAESGARELAPEPEAAGTSGPQSGPPAGRDGEPDAAEPGPREAPEAAEGGSPGAPAPALSPGLTLTPELAARLLEMLASLAAAGYDGRMKGGAHHEEGSQAREGGGPAGPAPAGRDGRQEDRQRSGGDARHLPQVMAQLAEGRAQRPASGHDAPGARPPAETHGGPGTSKPPEDVRGTGETDRAAGMLDHDHQGGFRPDGPES